MIRRVCFWLLFCALILTLLVLALLATLSWTAPKIAREYLLSQGYDLAIGKTAINAFKGSASFNDVSFIAKQEDPSNAKASSEALVLNHLSLDFDIWELLRHQRVNVAGFMLRGLSVPIVKENKLYRVANIEIDPTTSEVATNEQSATSSSELPAVSWQSIVIEDIELELRDPQISEEPTQLALSELKLGPFSSNNLEQQTPFSALIQSDEFSLGINGSSQLLSESIQGSAEVDLDKLDTSLITGLISFLPEGLINPAPLEPLLTGKLASEISYASAITWSLDNKPAVNIRKTKLDIHSFSFEQVQNKTKRLAKIDGTFDVESIQFFPDSSQFEVLDATVYDSSVNYSETNELGQTIIALTELEVDIDQLNSSLPEKPSKLSLNSKFGEFGTIEASGQSSLMDIGADTQLAIETNQIDLITLSLLIESALDRSIESGQLSSQNAIAIKERQLKVENELRLDQFQLAGSTNEEQDDPLELGIPLNTALNLLRDKNDRIELQLPVDGSLDDPEFSLQPVINKALFKSIRTGVMTQVGPLFAVSAIGKALDIKDALSLKPIYFENLSVALDDEAIANIDSLADLLKKRSKISIRLCPVYTKTENEAKPQADNQPSNGDQLSTQRLSAVKERLLKAGIEGQRIVPCAAKLDEGEPQRPRIKANF